jgi:KDO2-lipid IV(A) lauroyltransferase
VLYIISDFLYFFVGPVFGYRKKVIMDNLQGSFPEKPLSELRKIRNRFYHFFCDLFVENIKLLSISEKEIMKRMTFSNIDEAKEGFKKYQMMHLYLGHYGNWEWIASLQYWMRPDVLTSQVYHPLYNKVFDRLFIHLRGQYGGESIPMKNTLRRMFEMKREGIKVVVGLISDQQPKWNSIHHFTRFLNRDTAVFTGAETIAKKLGGMVTYGRMHRIKRGYYNLEFINITNNPSEYKDFEITDKYMSLLEEDIVAHPEYWLWSHKRWSRTKEEWLERQKGENA